MKIPKRIAHAMRLTFALVALLAAVSPAAAQAFTLIQPAVKLFVNPKAGYTTSVVQVRATGTVNNTCNAGTQLNFNFYFDGKSLWNRNVSTCTAGAWDTGWSAYITPPVPRTVGKHTISVNMVNPSGGATLATASYVYSIYQAPASPQQQAPSPTPTPTPSPVVVSPSSSSCAATGMLPPTGTGSFGDALVAGLVMFSVIPIVGLALIGPGPLLAAARRRRKLFMLLGLSALAALTLSCASSVAEQPTPATLVSPVSSPSCSA